MVRVKDAAESLNACLRKLVESQDDQPTPTVESVHQEHSLDAPHNQPSGDELPAATVWVTDILLCVQFA